VRGDVVSYNWKISAMVERTIVKKDENKEANTAGVETSQNGVSLAPALDLRSISQGSSQAPISVSHASDTPSLHLLRQCPIPFPHRCVQPLAQSIATSGVLPRQHLQVRWVHFEQHCHIFILLDAQGDPTVLLGMALFAECRFDSLTPL
jgi:hypothetical protein